MSLVVDDINYSILQLNQHPIIVMAFLFTSCLYLLEDLASMYVVLRLFNCLWIPNQLLKHLGLLFDWMLVRIAQLHLVASSLRSIWLLLHIYFFYQLYWCNRSVRYSKLCGEHQLPFFAGWNFCQYHCWCSLFLISHLVVVVCEGLHLGGVWSTWNEFGLHLQLSEGYP